MKYSDANRIDAIGNDDLIALGHEDEQGSTGYVSGVSTVTQIGEKLNNSLEYSTALETTDKTIIGAINELADGGASADITSEITTPASIQTFNDGGDNIPLKSLVTEIVPIQEGSGVPSPDNVRAISGHDTIIIENPITANIFNPSRSLNGYYFNANGTISHATAYSISDYLPTKTSMRIGTLANAIRFVFYDNKFEYISSYRETASVAQLTIPQDAKWVRFSYMNTDESNIQVVWGNTLPTYQAYQGINKTINLPSTVYGGSLECVEGEGQSKLEYVELTGVSPEYWQMPQTSIFYETTTFVDGLTTDSKICNRYEYGGVLDNMTDLSGMENNKFYCLLINQYKRFYFKDTRFTTLADWKTEIDTNHIQICYEKATPTSLSVSGANIPTLSGTNNIYTDCGDIQSLEYFNEQADDIDSLVDLEVRLSGRIRTKTYTGDGSVPLVVTFDEVPTMILNFFGPGQGSQVITFPFVYGLTSFGGVYVSPNPWSSPTQAGGGHLLYKVAYSNGGKTMTIRASANDAGAHFNQSGDTYTVYYLV